MHRALSRDPRCREQTAERIRSIAEEMGYRPDPIFSTMGARRGRKSADGVLLALLIHSTSREKRIGKSLLAPIREHANRLGYRIETFDLTEYQDSPARLWKILYARGCAGVLVSHARREQEPVLQFNRQFPIVCIGRGDALPYNTVRPAILTAIHLAWERMHELGYRRIGAAIYRHEPFAEDDFSRLAGCLASPVVLKGGGAAIPPYTEPHDDHSKFNAWMKRHKPDAILGFSRLTHEKITSLGHRIPQDVGFASLHLDSISPSDSLFGRLAGISQNGREIARWGINLLDQMIRHGDYSSPELPLNLLIPSTWIDGPSLPPRRQQP